MRLFKFLTSVFFVTALGLLYVHQQVELVKLSYAIECKEKRLKDVLDHKEALGYNIDNLEAPSRLEGMLLAQKIEIAFPKKAQVVKIAKLTTAFNDTARIRSVGVEKKPDILGFFDFLNPRAEAQAKEK